jgi:lon-related putative ATP-dependent protease
MATRKPKPLSIDRLRNTCDPKQFSFKTTEELVELQDFLGQHRALKATTFGIGVNCSGFNIFAMGPAGQGKRSIIQSLLNQQAAGRPQPYDICYIHNFKDPKSPVVLKLIAGLGRKLADDMAQLLQILRTEIPAIFESKAYADRIKEIQDNAKKKQESAFLKLEQEAVEHDITILRTPDGFMLALLKDGKIVSEEAFAGLPKSERETKEALMHTLQEHLENYLEEMPAWQKELQKNVKEAIKYFIMLHVGSIFGDIKKQYVDHKEVQSYLAVIEQEILDNPKDFLKKAEGHLGMISPDSSDNILNRYGVNVVVDNGKLKGAPVIYEDNPQLANLVGRIDHISQFGALITDFTLIRAGALHRANGGYLILDAQKLIMQPFAWEGLKRALRAKMIRVENINQLMGFMGTVSLEPQPVPLDVKVILIGDRRIYYLLCAMDPEFLELFKVAADFDETMPRTPQNSLLFAQLLKTLSKTDCISPLTKEAVARVIEHASVLVGDNQKMSTHVGKLTDLLREANHYASLEKRQTIDQAHIENAIDQQIERASRLKEQEQHHIERGIILIDTSGRHIGQINGLSIIELGDIMFGHPVRITARTGLGHGGVIDIEREVKLGGPLHSKGVLILSGYLTGQFMKKDPLSLSLSLVFEQSYGGVEGDSASVAEACVILSALSMVPIKQSIAITGSMNQHGQVQAVGGINEKILGFFEIVKKRGFSEKAGVIIPAANVDNLMLHKDIIEAVKHDQFQIYAVKTVDEAMEILTDLKAGVRSKSGKFPRGSINYKTEAALATFSGQSKKKSSKK